MNSNKCYSTSICLKCVLLVLLLTYPICCCMQISVIVHLITVKRYKVDCFSP